MILKDEICGSESDHSAQKWSFPAQENACAPVGAEEESQLESYSR